ncbi:hypothetical protein ACVIHA_003492 [Bradyrhizobium liaoningense]
MEKLSGIRRITSSGSVWTLRARIIVLHRQLLRAVGPLRMVVAQDFAEHQLAGVGDLPQGYQVVPVKALHARAERRVAKGNLGLFDRARKDDVEADHLGPALGDAPEHPTDLARPGLRRRSLERRGVVGLPVDRHHDDRRRGGVTAIANDLAAQRREDVEGETLQRLKRR